MSNDYETFINLYQGAEPEIQEFLDSDKIGEFTDSLLVKHSLAPEKKPALISAIADLVLDSQLSAESILENMNIENTTKAQVVKDITTFTSNIVSDPKSAHMRPVTENSSEAKAESIVQTQKTIPPMRTMFADMQQDKHETITPSSSQEDLLKGSNK
jgi:phenylpyruvate tautomerase PptA (4-oxalocrotonate tautomerase family)